MSQNVHTDVRVLAIDLTVRGFGFAVFEGRQTLLDWGITSSRRHRQRWTLRKAGDLMKTYVPAVLVVENPAQTRRPERVCRLINEIAEAARLRRIRVRFLSREDIRKAFSKTEAKNKYELALLISQWLPDLAPYRPRFRKPWMSEDPRMNIFDAAALALTYFLKLHPA